MQRLCGYDRRRYWLVNGWCIRFRVHQVERSDERPHGIRYSFTLHDIDGTRLLGFDNAHGVNQAQTYDHNHRLGATYDIRPYRFRGADELISDFFGAVERACADAGVPFDFEAGDVEIDELGLEETDDEP